MAQETSPDWQKKRPWVEEMEIISNSVKETINIGKSIARHLKPGDIICLFGEFGAGKTVLAKGIAEGLGIPKQMVISPSFVLMRQFTKGKLPVYHFDLYRLGSIRDILALGYEEYLYADGVSLVEWARKLGRLMPREHLGVKLVLKPGTKRRLKLIAFGRRHKELLKKINENISH